MFESSRFSPWWKFSSYVLLSVPLKRTAVIADYPRQRGV